VENLLHPIVQEEMREQLHRGNILGIENLRWVKDGFLADLLIGRALVVIQVIETRIRYSKLQVLN
jgi:hypothetical protein